MNKRNVIFIISVLILIIILLPVGFFLLYVAGYWFAYDIKAKIPIILKQEKWCDKLFDENQEYAEYGNLLERCYRDVAIEKNDEKICEKIKMREYQEVEINGKIQNVPFSGHRDICFDTIAFEKQEEDICANMISENKAYCYGNIARNKRNPNICADLQTDDFRRKCYSDMFWDNAAGNMLGDIRVSISNCDKIENLEKREKCKYYFDNFYKLLKN